MRACSIISPQVAMLCVALISAQQCRAQSAVRITFDGPPPQPFGVWTNYAEAGMSFSGRYARMGAGAAIWPQNGTAYVSTGVGSYFAFSFTNRSLFDLVPVDLAEYSTVVPNAVTVQFVGYHSDGSSVTTSFTTDGIIDGTGPLAEFETFHFGPEFSGLTRVEIPTSGWSLDNLVVSVPEPVPVLLLAPGGVLLWWLTRCRRHGRSG